MENSRQLYHQNGEFKIHFLNLIMVFNYYYNLSKKQQYIYRKSDEIDAVILPGARNFTAYISTLRQALAHEERSSVIQSARRLINGMSSTLGIQPVEIKVLSVRPSNARGELHGLYETAVEGHKAVITVWMRTARHKRVVAFKTFLRTLVHEFCHHLDYEYYRLADSYHTEGFFKRESSLLKQLLPETG